MRCLFRKSPAATQKCLQIITGDDTLKVVQNRTQVDLKRLVGARSLTLDVLATDANDRLLNLEVQRDPNGASIRRLRYHGSALDVENLEQGHDFDELPDVRVIFITEKDMFSDGLPLHEHVLYDLSVGRVHDDGKHLIYVNGEYRGEDPLGDLMHDFNCDKAEDMRIPEMRNATYYLKNTEGGQKYMCEIMEDIRKDGAIEAVVDYGRKMHNSDAQIRAYLKEEYKLSDEEINKYLKPVAV